MEESEMLYYQCCGRINQDIEVAEPFLVGCIHYVLKDKGIKCSRQMIKDHLCMSNYEPYIRELRFISFMREDSIYALITSSLDLSHILKQVEIIYDHAKDSDYSLVQGSTHTNKAKRAGEMLTKLSKLMKPTTKVKTDSSLF